MTSKVYELVFTSQEVSKSGKPEIGIVVERECFGELLGPIKRLSEVYADDVKEYVRSRNPPQFRLGPGEKSGHAFCARIERSDDTVTYHFPLSYIKKRFVVASISLLLRALSTVRTSDSEEHQCAQMVEISSRFGDSYQAHAVRGTIYPILGHLLVRGAEGALPFYPRDVVSAMREVWRAVAEVHLKRYASDCRFHLHDDGRPIFSCFGDACDLAVYPEGVIQSLSKYPAEFGSHNLDLAEQQLTLLAGLAQLCTVCREKVESRD